MQHTPYQTLGGESTLRQLVERFYYYMDTLPQAAKIRQLHPQDLANAQNKLFMFLSGWLGGPDLFQPQFGHPRLRMRHLPFAIDDSARDAWMLCMQKALDELQPGDQAFRLQLLTRLYQTADFMRNQP